MSRLTDQEFDMLQNALEAELDASELTVVSDFDNGDVPMVIDVVSPKFQGLSQLQRQDLVWSIIDRVLGEHAKNVSMIVAYTPSEIESPAA